MVADLHAAEVDYLCAHEWARSAEDILWRRSKLGLRLDQREQRRLADYLGCPSLAAAAAGET